VSNPVSSEDGDPVLVEPDLAFIRALGRQGGDTLKKCFQCGTCSSACALSPDAAPFPRKEMAWAVWGMKDRLINDPDVWLCHQCNDCSTRCPRGARPGDVLAAIRQESVAQHAVPGFLGRWVNEPSCIPLLLGIPTALLTLALCFSLSSLRDSLENLLGISSVAGEGIVYSYSHMFPHWLLNGFFLFFSVLVLVGLVASVGRFWKAMKARAAQAGPITPVKGLFPSILAALASVFTHDKFASCEKTHLRFYSHLCVFFGFLGLCLVTMWVITSSVNPLIRDDFVYPFRFLSPWKLLANAGGAALLAGCALMIFDRLRDSEKSGAYADWALIATLAIVTATGFVTEALHYVRLEPHRHVAYFIHLVFVFALLMYLPYSKLAHVVYRTTAIVFAEHIGRNGGATPAPAEDEKNPEKEEENHAADGIE